MVPPNDVPITSPCKKMVAARFPKETYRKLRLSAFENELSIQAFLITAVENHIECLAQAKAKPDA